MPTGLAFQVREDYFQIAAELPEDLAACAAGWGRGFGVGDNRDATEFAVAFREGFEHRHALGADGEAVRSVLDVAAGDDEAGRRLQRGADFESGIRGVRVPARTPRAARPAAIASTSAINSA